MVMKVCDGSYDYWNPFLKKLKAQGKRTSLLKFDLRQLFFPCLVP